MSLSIDFSSLCKKDRCFGNPYSGFSSTKGSASVEVFKREVTGKDTSARDQQNYWHCYQTDGLSFETKRGYERVDCQNHTFTVNTEPEKMVGLLVKLTIGAESKFYTAECLASRLSMAFRHNPRSTSGAFSCKVALNTGGDGQCNEVWPYAIKLS